MPCVLLTVDGLPTAGLSFRNFCPVAAALRLIRAERDLLSVLIVDDHAIIRAQIRATLENYSEGFVVCGEAENGFEGITKALDLKPDLILLDLSMPVMNGLEAAANLRKLLPAVPIFLLTAHNGRATEEAALQAGVHKVFYKHQDLTVLIEHARVVCSGRPSPSRK
jgi:DNA-binding NarL/FixJ family response regulator